METQVKKREWVKTAAIIFLAVLLVLTFFSNTIMNRSLPEVATQSVVSGTINAKIRGSGTISANETYDVTISQTRKVASVLVKVGQTVAAGDTLFTLEEQQSDELKTAQDALETMELNYEKSLLALSNTSSQSNHDVQKAQQAYNEAVAVYNQYSTMDSTKLAAALAQANVKLKELTKAATDAQEAYTEASTATEYTEAQGNITTLKATIATLETTISDLQTQIDELGTVTDVTAEIARLKQQRSGLESDLAAANDALERDKTDSYNSLYAIADKEEAYMAIYATDQDLLVSVILEKKLAATEAEATTKASQMIADFNQYLTDQEKVAGISNEISSLDSQISSLQESVSTLQAKQKLQTKLDAADSELRDAKRDLSDAEDTVSTYEKRLSNLKSAASDAKDAQDAQQTQVDKYTSASTASETVKSTRQALEDLVFAQSLGSSDALDIQAAKDAIEKQKKTVEDLTKNADSQEVTAKVGGVIGAINVTAGNSIGADSALATINVTDRGYTIKISITTDQAKQVKVGDTADLVNYWGSDITATLESIANDPKNPGKGKMLVFRITGDVEPETNLTLSIGQKSANYDTLVPNSAIRSDNNGSFVLVVVSKSSPLGNRYVATRADVQVLAKDDVNTAVSGLSAGDFVITTSTKPIVAGNQVRLVDNG